MGWGLFVCIYSCIHVHVCMHKCMYISVYVFIMYVLCMHNTYICVYVCMYTNTNQIYNARNVTPKFNFLNGLVRGLGSPLDSQLVRMHKGNCNLINNG